MPTLQEIMNASYAMEEKTASAIVQPDAAHAVISDDETLKIATELGIYNELFPEDAQPVKTAEEVKVAEYQECLGARAHDFFARRFDQRMDKIAGEIMSAADMNAAQGIMQPSNRPPVAEVTNQDPVGDKMPRKPGNASDVPYSVAAGQEAGAEGQVGHEQKMAACLRKHFLLAGMN